VTRGEDLFDRVSRERMGLRVWRHVRLRGVAHAGQLFKALRGTLAKSWERRLFVLAGCVLSYYANADALEATGKVEAALRRQLAAAAAAAVAAVSGGGDGAPQQQQQQQQLQLVRELEAASARLAALRAAGYRRSFFLVPGRTEVVIPATAPAAATASGGGGGGSSSAGGVAAAAARARGGAPLLVGTFPTPYVLQLVNPSLRELAARGIVMPPPPPPPPPRGAPGGSGSGGAPRGRLPPLPPPPAAQPHQLTPQELAGPGRDVLTLCADSSEERRGWILFLKARLRHPDYVARLRGMYDDGDEGGGGGGGGGARS
jgi:hypothetical protein